MSQLNRVLKQLEGLNTKDLSPVHCSSTGSRFVNVDHDTPLLLPPNLRDWVPSHPLAHFILDAVQTLDLRRVRLEWTLVSTAYNLKRLHRMATAVG